MTKQQIKIGKLYRVFQAGDWDLEVDCVSQINGKHHFNGHWIEIRTGSILLCIDEMASVEFSKGPTTHCKLFLLLSKGVVETVFFRIKSDPEKFLEPCLPNLS